MLAFRRSQLESELADAAIAYGNRLVQEVLRINGCFLFIIYSAIVIAQNHLHLLLGSSKQLEVHLACGISSGHLAILIHHIDVHNQVLVGTFHDSQLTIWHEVLGESLLLVWHEPCEVRLVLGEHTCHQLDVWTIGIGEVAVPSLSEVSITPCPLLLAWRYMVIGHMEHTSLGIILITTLKVELRVHAHIGCRHLDVLVVGNIHTSGIVHLIIGTRGDRETAHGTLAMVKHGIDVLREHTLVIIVHCYSRVGPPKESLRHVGAIIETTLDFEISLARTKCESSHTLLMEHLFHLVHPYGNRAILILLDGAIHWEIGTWTMVLRPVELNATADPRTSQPHQCRFDDMIIIYKVTLLDLIVCHLHTTAQLGQNHHLDVFILNPDGMPLLIHLFIADTLDDRIRINHTTRTLINSFFQENRILLRGSHLIGWNHHCFSPSFYHNYLMFY